MSATGLDVFDKTLQTTSIWLDELMQEIGHDRQVAWHVLGAVLRGVRDRIPLELAAHLGAQLPLLVLQLRFDLAAVVSGCRFSLVPSSPGGPGHDEASADWGPEPETRQKIADLGHRRQQRCQAPQAAARTAGLLSFALLQVARRRSAANRARKAPAARHRLMCRCHPCQERAAQWSRPRSSLARSKHASIVQRSPAAPASSPSETPTGAKAKE